MSKETTDKLGDDSGRLDWLERLCCTLGHDDLDLGWYVSGTPWPKRYRTAREAIDEAIRFGKVARQIR